LNQDKASSPVAAPVACIRLGSHALIMLLDTSKPILVLRDDVAQYLAPPIPAGIQATMRVGPNRQRQETLHV
jgi:hypothetical protein